MDTYIFQIRDVDGGNFQYTAKLNTAQVFDLKAFLRKQDWIAEWDYFAVTKFPLTRSQLMDDLNEAREYWHPSRPSKS